MISFWNSSALSCAAISRERTPAHPNSRLSRFAASDRRDSEKPRQPPHKCKPLTRTVGLREVSRSAIVLPRVSLAPLFGSRGSDLSKMRIFLDTHQRHARTRRQPADGNHGRRFVRALVSNCHGSSRNARARHITHAATRNPRVEYDKPRNLHFEDFFRRVVVALCHLP
jgi:hypothetical protein